MKSEKTIDLEEVSAENPLAGKLAEAPGGKGEPDWAR